MRLFLAIPLAEPVLAELGKLTGRLQPAAAGLRWSAEEKWHITLQFLGGASEDQYNCLVASLAQLRSPPVPIQLAELGIFDRAGIFYAEVDLTPQLVSLQQRIVAATALCGFESESRPFHPHITLARVKGPNRARDLHGLQSSTRVRPHLPRFIAREFLLYESHLSSEGSTYEIRRRYPLAAMA
jgi:RNA 2',3'-cyclic 3'-phosphodiesterase